MKCCGHDITSVELQVADAPYVLYRCGECNSSYWMRDGVNVPFADVTAAMREETMALASARSERRAQRERRGRP